MATHHRARDDKGITVPLLAISLLALMAVAGLVMDGGQAYAQRRQMQNAADAAAMAGAGALDDVRFAGSPASSVETTVETVAADNGAEDVLTCQIIDADGDRLGACSDATAVLDPNAVGVEVETKDVQSTTFARVLGTETVAATADASATIQPIVGARAPWAICSSGSAYDFLTDEYKIDPVAAAAMGKIVIQGSQIYKDDGECDAKSGGGGGGASFKGKIGSPYTQVGESTIAPNDPGNALPDDWEEYLVPCPVAPTTNECALLPVAYRVEESGANAEVFVSDFAYWRLEVGTTGVEQMYGTWVAPAGPGVVLPGTNTGSGDVTEHTARTTALIE